MSGKFFIFIIIPKLLYEFEWFFSIALKKQQQKLNSIAKMLKLLDNNLKPSNIFQILFVLHEYIIYSFDEKQFFICL